MREAREEVTCRRMIKGVLINFKTGKREDKINVEGGREKEGKVAE